MSLLYMPLSMKWIVSFKQRRNLEIQPVPGVQIGTGRQARRIIINTDTDAEVSTLSFRDNELNDFTKL